MDVPHGTATSTQASWAITKIWHTLNGLYVWEFILSLDYEWRIIRGRLPYRWTIWVYSLTRVAALVGVTLCFVAMDVTTPLDCQFLVQVSAAFFYLSVVAAQLLIVLRNIAIWNRNKVVVVLSITIWMISVAFHIRSAALLRAVWATQHTCDPVGTKSSVLSFIPTILFNMVLLLIMLAGLIILRRHNGGRLGLSGLLWKQGIIWSALTFATEVPPLVFLVLNLNSHLNITYETPCLIPMIIAATRMHRHLVDFASEPPDLAHEDLQISKIVFARTDTTATSMPNRIEVTVHTAFDEHPTAEINDDSSSVVSTNDQGSQTAGDTLKLESSRPSTETHTPSADRLSISSASTKHLTLRNH